MQILEQGDMKSPILGESQRREFLRRDAGDRDGAERDRGNRTPHGGGRSCGGD